MDIDALLELTSEGLELWRSGDTLHYRIPDTGFFAATETALVQHKQAILSILGDRDQIIGPFRLSPAVQAMLVTQQLMPGTSANNLRCPLLFRRSLDLDALHRAIDMSLREHPMLRACFPLIDGTPYLFFQRSVAPDVNVDQCERLDDASLRQWMQGPALAPFELARGPLIRFHVLQPRSRADRFCLLISAHHTVMDFQSLELLLTRIAGQLVSDAGASESDDETARLCLADHSRLQRCSFDEADRESTTFWTQTVPRLCAGVGPDHRDEQSFAGEELHVAVPDALADRLAEYARENGVTEFAVYLAVFCVAYRQFAEQDSVVGVSVSCRDRHPAPDIVGCYINSLPAVATVAAIGETSRTWLRKVSHDINEALRHRSFPFARLARLSPLARRARRPVLFDALFTWLAFESAAPPDYDALYSILRPTGPMPVGVTHDLTLSVHVQPGAKWLVWSYDTKIFDGGLVSALSSEYLQLLMRAVESPERILIEDNSNGASHDKPDHREEFLL